MKVNQQQIGFLQYEYSNLANLNEMQRRPLN